MNPLFNDGVKPKNKALTVITDQEIDKLGSNLNNNLQNISKQMLEQVRASDTGELGTKINAIISTAKELDPTTLNKPGMMTSIKNLFKSSKDRMMAKYQSVDGRMKTLLDELDKSTNLHVKRIGDIRNLSIENLKTHEELRACVEQGERMLVEMRSQISAIDTSNLEFAEQQELVMFTARADRLEKKIDDLKRSMLLAKQAAPQLMALENNARVLASKFVDIKTTTIPAWQQAFTMYIIQGEQIKSAQLANSVQDATEEALLLSSQMTKSGTLEVAKLQQRASVDIKVLQQIQNNLLTTFDEVAKITEQGRQSRQQAEQELIQLEQQLAQRFLPKGQ